MNDTMRAVISASSSSLRLRNLAVRLAVLQVIVFEYEFTAAELEHSLFKTLQKNALENNILRQKYIILCHRH
jgi:hypothetical protein